MATVIKLNVDIEINGCSNCPFLCSIEMGDSGLYTNYCSFLGINSHADVEINGEIDTVRRDKPETCPIIENKAFI